MLTYSLKVAEIRRETADTITLCFKQPGLKKVRYLAGQYLTLIFRINRRRFLRPYSFSSSPAIDQFLEVTIKRVPNGVVSNHVHDMVQVGDNIEVLPPMGDFTYRQDGKEVVMWSAGSGITPLMSLAKTILSEDSDVPVTLIYGNRNQEETIFFNQIAQLEQIYADRFRVFHFRSQAAPATTNSRIVSGRISSIDIGRLLSEIHITNSNHYICGPAGLKELVTGKLRDAGVNKENIYFEDFELIKDPKDFFDILTRFVKLKYDNNVYDIEVSKGKNILETALDAGIEIPYSCQTGTCNTCKATVVSGQVRMIGVAQDSTRIDEECLLCCSYPLDDEVIIEIK